MIFKTVNLNIEKAAYDINIKNIDLAQGHWHSEGRMVDFLDGLEVLVYEKDTIDKKLVLNALQLKKDNLRIKDMKFYRIPEEHRIVLFVVSNIAKFKEPEIFTREMSITLKRHKFAFSIIEVLVEENELIKKGEKTIPANWVLDETLTARWQKLKEYA